MTSLHQQLKTKISSWRENSYITNYPAISEILKFNQDNFLRKAQLEALETYWYLRLVEKTPHIFDLYKNAFTNKQELLETFGLKHLVENLSDDLITEDFTNQVIRKIKTEDDFVKQNKLEALRETLNLNYPSYILALAMGAGKTILISSIIATEFAMALEYQNDDKFVRNALIFAPGKTILGALREIAETPYEKILPKRFYKSFITNSKFTYTRDGEKDIPVIEKSNFNIIVTNTEKIRLQKGSIPKSYVQGQLSLGVEEAKGLIANKRLQTITSLPNLAVFSDEAHHTFGQKLAEDLKRVRQTINHINEQTNLVVVVNTTGTPYYKRQLLRDVVYWYGLSQGIDDNILKAVRGNIVAYDEVGKEQFVTDVTEDFFTNYGKVKIFDGSLTKLAIYFPQIDDLIAGKTVVEQKLISMKIDPSVIRDVHSRSPEEVQDLFDNRANDPKLPYRVFLLVNKGTEGWNCPSLFATALARKLKTSNNFVLQAASRCLRQVPGNTLKAKIYLSKDNVSILDAQLQETYGESLEDLNRAQSDIISIPIKLHKSEIKPLSIKKFSERFVPRNKDINQTLTIQKPKEKEIQKLKKTIYDLSKIQRGRVLIEQDTEEAVLTEPLIDLYTAAAFLAQEYRLDSLTIFKLLTKSFNQEVTIAELHFIRQQIEKQVCDYEVVSEAIEEALAIVRKEGFEKQEIDGKTTFVAEIKIKKDRLSDYLLYLKDYKIDKQLPLFGFHYSPYNFDSLDEKEFFETLLNKLGEDKDDIEDIYYTGAISDSKKTDFIFEVKDKQDEWHHYTPDFLIRKKNGKSLIVEVKGKPYWDEMAKSAKQAMERLQNINKDKIKYEVLVLDKEDTIFSKIKPVQEWIYGPNIL